MSEGRPKAFLLENIKFKFSLVQDIDSLLILKQQHQKTSF